MEPDFVGTTLTKTQTVLTLTSKWKEAHPGLHVSTVPFACPAEESESRTHLLWLDRLVWADMGSPDTITVTIEPGDKLNV